MQATHEKLYKTSIGRIRLEIDMQHRNIFHFYGSHQVSLNELLYAFGITKNFRRCFTSRAYIDFHMKIEKKILSPKEPKSYSGALTRNVVLEF